MKTSNETARDLLDTRIILAVLWIAGMLCSLNGDTYRLSDPAALTAILENSGPLKSSVGLLTVMSIIFVGYIMMGALTILLRSPAARRINRIAGSLYAAIILGFWVLGFVLGPQSGYAIVWSSAQLVFAALVVWYAWKWNNPATQS